MLHYHYHHHRHYHQFIPANQGKELMSTVSLFFLLTSCAGVVVVEQL